MSETLAVVLTVAVGLIAITQVGLLLVAVSAIRRLDAEMGTLSGAVLATLHRVEQTAAEVGELTADVRDTVGHARQAVAHVGAVVGAGRSLVEGALGSALLRRLGLGTGRVGGATAAGVTQAVISAGVAIWRALRARRVASPVAGADAAATNGAVPAGPPAASAPERAPLRAGRARRLASREVSVPVPGTPPVGGGPGVGA